MAGKEGLAAAARPFVACLDEGKTVSFMVFLLWGFKGKILCH